MAHNLSEWLFITSPMTPVIDDPVTLEQLRTLPINDLMALGISAFHNNGTCFVNPRVRAAFQTRLMQHAAPTEANVKNTAESEVPKDVLNIEHKRGGKLEKPEKHKPDAMVAQVDNDADGQLQNNKDNILKERPKGIKGSGSVISILRASNEESKLLEDVMIPAMASSNKSNEKRKRPESTPPIRNDTLQSMESFGEPTDANELVIEESKKKKKKTKHEHREVVEEVQAALEPDTTIVDEQPKPILSDEQMKMLRSHFLREAALNKAQSTPTLSNEERKMLRSQFFREAELTKAQFTPPLNKKQMKMLRSQFIREAARTKAQPMSTTSNKQWKMLSKQLSKEAAVTKAQAAPKPETTIVDKQPKPFLNRRQRKLLRWQLSREAAVTKAQSESGAIVIDEILTSNISEPRDGDKEKANQFLEKSPTNVHTFPAYKAPSNVEPFASNRFQYVQRNEQSTERLGEADKRPKKMFPIPEALFSGIDMEEESRKTEELLHHRKVEIKVEIDEDMKEESRKMKELLNHREVEIKVETDQDMTENSVGNERDTSSRLSVTSSNQGKIDDRAVPIGFQPSSDMRSDMEIPILPPITRTKSVEKSPSTTPSESTHSLHGMAPEASSETLILPPKRVYTQVATCSNPSINQKPTTLRLSKTNSKKTYVDEVSNQLTHNGSGLTRSSAIPDIRAAESAESVDQPDTFYQTINDLKAASQKMHALFSPSPDPEDDPSLKGSMILSASQPPAKPLTSTFTSGGHSSNTPVRNIIAAHDVAFHNASSDENAISDDWMTSAGYQGRIRSIDTNQDNGETDEYFAFSSMYMASKNDTLRLSNTLFQKKTLTPGAGWVIGRDDSEFMDMMIPDSKGNGVEVVDGITLRICSVVKGRVDVQLAGEKFLLDEGGVWRVRKGEECIVQNAYRDVHVKKGTRDAVVVCFGVE